MASDDNDRLKMHFVDREMELDELKRYLNEAKRSVGRVVFIAGEPGIGKSTLLAEFCKRAASEGVEVLKCRCVSRQNSIPYAPFIEMLTGGSTTGEDDSTGGDSGSPYTTSEILPLSFQPLSSEKETAHPVSDVENILTERNRMFDTVSQYIIEMSKERPLLLAMDDLQWADKASLRLLHYITLRIRSSRVLVCGTYRTDEVDAVLRELHPLKDIIQRLNAEKVLRVMTLGGLSRDDTEAIIFQVLRPECISDVFINDLHTQSGGNPLFIEEVLKSLKQDGSLDNDLSEVSNVTAKTQIKLPNTIKDITLRRLEKLTGTSREIIAKCSVIGNDFAYTILLKISGFSENKLLDALDELLSFGFIKEDQSSKEEIYSFENIHTRSAVYGMLNPDDLVTIHRSVGEAILEYKKKSLDDVIYSLAYHFTLGKNQERSYIYSEKAAEKSAKVYAFDDAIMYFTWALKALEALESDIRTGRVIGEKTSEIMKNKYNILKRLGDMWKTLSWENALLYYRHALEVSEKLSDPVAVAKSYSNVGLTLSMLARFDESKTNYNRSLELYKSLSDLQSMAGVYLSLGYISWRIGMMDDAVTYHNLCIQNAIICGNIRDLGRAYSSMASVFTIKGDFKKAEDFFHKGISELIKVKDYINVAVSYNNLGDIALRSGDYDKAIGHFEKCIVFAKLVGEKLYIATANINSGEAYARKGELEKALWYEEEGLKLIELTGDPIGKMWVYKNFGIIYRMQQKWQDANESFEKAHKIIEGKSMPFEEAELNFEIGLMYKEKGENDKAVEIFEKAQRLYSSINAEKNMIQVKKELESLKLKSI
jgi:tetratricopeptide (TPR) repeat protein